MSKLEATFDIDQYSTSVPSMNCAYYGNNVKGSNEVDEILYGMDTYCMIWTRIKNTCSIFNDPLMDVALE